MKPLKESLFDNDIISRKLPYEKLLKGRISKNDILHFIIGSYEGDFVNIKNPKFLEWCNDFWDREVGDKNGEILRVGYYTWDQKDDIAQEALDWLKPGKIHNKVYWNDAMYANSIDVSWYWWGKEQQWNNITEWVLITEKSGTGYDIYLLANRKEYNEIDQAMIHKMIEILGKK